MQIEKIYPASNIQASIVAGYLASNKKDYIGQLTIPVSNIDHLPLNRAVQILYARHEALRTAFDWQNQKGVTSVVADKLPQANYINEYTVENINSIDHIKDEEAEILTLNKPPLIRLALIRCDAKSFLLWTRHHAVTDQESIKIFWSELWHFYSNPHVQLQKAAPFSDFAILKATNLVDAPVYHEYLPLVDDERIENSYTLQSSELTNVLGYQKNSNVTLASYTLSAFCLALAEILSSDSFTVGYVESDRPDRFKNSIGLYIKESLIRQDQANLVTIGEHRSHIFKSVLGQRNVNYNLVDSSSNSQIGFLFEDDPDSQSLDTLENNAGINVRLKIFCRVSLINENLSINLSSQTQAIRSTELDSLQKKILHFLLLQNQVSIHNSDKSPRQYLADLIWHDWRHNNDIVLADSSQVLTGDLFYAKVEQFSEYIASAVQSSTNTVLLIKPSRSIQCVINILASIHAGFPFLLTDKSDISHVTTKLKEDMIAATLDYCLPVNTVYLVRTSGSTGISKTILIHANNLINHLQYRVSENSYSSRVAHTSAWTFDASLTVLFSTMVKGGFLSILPLVTDYVQTDDFFKLIAETNINEINMVPSLLRLFVSYGLENTSIHTITSAGEELTPELANLIHNDTSIQLINEYGPSECTILSTRSLISSTDSVRPSIGIPITGCKIELQNIDDSVDEICIAGDFVGLGYLGDQLKNQKSFFYNRGILWYRSGDVGRFNSNGNLQWLGRTDHQLKINGKIFNIETVEQDLVQLGAKECKCIFLNSMLYSFYSAADKGLFDHDLLKQKYREKFGIVCDFIYLQQLPKSSSGKIDIQKLRHHISNALVESTKSLDKAKDHSFVESIIGRPIQVNNKPFLDVDSLQAIRLISSINKQFNLNLTVTSLLSSSSWGEFLSLFSTSTQGLDANTLPSRVSIKKREYQ